MNKIYKIYTHAGHECVLTRVNRSQIQSKPHSINYHNANVTLARRSIVLDAKSVLAHKNVIDDTTILRYLVFLLALGPIKLLRVITA